MIDPAFFYLPVLSLAECGSFTKSSPGPNGCWSTCLHLRMPGNREKRSGKDKWALPPLRSLSKFSSHQLQLTLWSEILTCSHLATREPGKCCLHWTHCHPLLHWDCFPKGIDKIKRVGSKHPPLSQWPSPPSTAIITTSYSGLSMLHTFVQLISQ